MPCFCGIHLITNSRHFPYRGIVVSIICIDIDIAACDIRCCKIIYDLLVIFRESHFGFLLNAGCQHGRGAGKNLVIVVFQLSLRRFMQIVGKSVAAGATQIGVDTTRQITAFQCADTLIAAIGVIHRGTDVVLCRDTVKAVIQEEFCACSIGQVRRKVIFHNRTDRYTAADLLQDIKSIKISVQIQNAERVGIRCIIKKILIVIGPDLLGHFFNGSGYTGISRELEQVADITGPASEVCRILVSGMIGHIHRTEHMRKVYLIAIWQSKNIEAAQSNSVGIVFCILLGYIAGKSRVFRTTESCPCTGRVFFYAAAYVIDDKCCWIFAGMFTGVSISISLKGSQ